jgi:hemerythrin-like domain-containing protein
MLAAECVCGILRAEHDVIRRTVLTLFDSTHGRHWRRAGPMLDRLKHQVGFLHTFNRLCHAPKRRHLWQPLWGRSDDVDRVLSGLECSDERNTHTLSSALSLLQAIEQGNASLGADLVLTMRRYRVAVLRQIEVEERDLVPLAHSLLTHDEWCRIASAMSAVPRAPAAPQRVLEEAEGSSGRAARPPRASFGRDLTELQVD